MRHAARRRMQRCARAAWELLAVACVVGVCALLGYLLTGWTGVF